MRLVWVDPDSGDYIPQQRRSYPCHLTWQGYPSWRLKEIAHLIETEEENSCPCRLHGGPNPFRVFHRHATETSPSADFTQSPAEDAATVSSPSLADESNSSEGPSSVYQASEFPTMFSPQPSILSMSPQPWTEDETVFSEVLSWDDQTSQNPHHEWGLSPGTDVTSLAWLDLFKKPPSPCLSLVSTRSSTETRLFHHFVNNIAMNMVPIDDICNPWRSIYPSIAIHDSNLGSVRSLYHATLAQSAYHLSNIKGAQDGLQEKANAMRHYGVALAQLRKSLVSPDENYSSVLGALLSVTLAEHVFEGQARGWQNHYSAAIEYVYQHSKTKPWRSSAEARAVTQNFALELLISQTVESCWGDSTISTNKLQHVLGDIMQEPDFGYSHGGTMQIFKALYQTRLLEERLTGQAGNHSSTAATDNESQLVQLYEIMQQLQTPVDTQVDAFMMHRQFRGVDAIESTRRMVRLHIQLFNDAVMVYLVGTVLHRPPRAVADHVRRVLEAASEFMDLPHSGRGPFSIWPVFIAAAAAYTPSTQAMATRCLLRAEKFGIANRKDAHRVVRQVWEDRDHLALLRNCDPADVFVNWRNVMKRLDTNILLL